ncbi:MAG TPA: hydrogenase [Deltaproteobacteria bacterium]|nr:hydrogenase [Deltaproteobacteria bacterium]
METAIATIEKEPLVEPGKTYADLANDVCKPLESFPTGKWYACFAFSLAALIVGVYCGHGLFTRGIGVWGLNQPVGWAVDITNFVFWIGIGHAGTLISAILFLFRQKWRTAINRSAEAMTIFAVMTAGIWPLIHTGRPWLAFYWLFPYPNQRQLWVNFRSPLLWDVFAVSTYFTVSLIFWYVGLIPDFATLREKTTSKVKHVIYSVFSLGWRFSNRHWQHYEMVYLILAGFATPLVLSVHTIVSFDFAVSIVPGWHTTIFPPYFVAGAVFSGFAMVQNVLIFVRKIFNYEHIITLDTLEKMNKIMMLTGSMVGYAYAMEFFIAWYSGVQAETFTFFNRALGPYAWAYWIMITCNVVSPQLFWFKKIRRSIPIMFVVAVFVNVGMWFERFVIIVTSVHRDYLPSSWSMFYPTWVDLGVYIGTIGIFSVFYLLFLKYFPVLAFNEVKSILKSSGEKYKDMSDEEFKKLHPIKK